MKVVAVFVFAAAAWAAAPAPDCSLVPGWQQKGPARTFVPDNLYEYMNGNSEGYFIYDFKRMNGVTCVQGDDTFVFDVSEMGTPEFAWGIFVANRDPKAAVEKIGTLGQVVPRRAMFAKDKYFIEIAAAPEKDHSAALRAFIAAMEKRIEGKAALPDATGWFPEEGLDRESIRMVPESVLGYRMLRRGYLALYKEGKAFVVPEASADAVAGVLAKFKARIGEAQPATVGDEAFQANDKYLGRLCVFRKGRYIAGFANLPENVDPVPLAMKLAARIQ